MYASFILVLFLNIEKALPSLTNRAELSPKPDKTAHGCTELFR